jgi:hypothetical protein
MDLLYFAPIVVGIIAWIWSGVMAFHDARRRGKPPVLVAMLVLLCAWPLSVLVWLALRPDVVSRRPFNLDDYRVQ